MCKEDSEITFNLSNKKENKLFHYDINFHKNHTIQGKW